MYILEGIVCKRITKLQGHRKGSNRNRETQVAGNRISLNPDMMFFIQYTRDI